MTNKRHQRITNFMLTRTHNIMITITDCLQQRRHNLLHQHGSQCRLHDIETIELHSLERIPSPRPLVPQICYY